MPSRRCLVGVRFRLVPVPIYFAYNQVDKSSNSTIYESWWLFIISLLLEEKMSIIILGIMEEYIVDPI